MNSGYVNPVDSGKINEYIKIICKSVCYPCTNEHCAVHCLPSCVCNRLTPMEVAAQTDFKLIVTLKIVAT